MNIEEYELVKAMSYYEYCDYLQKKYGIPKHNYFRPSFTTKDSKISRTKEGLVVHHKYEDHTPRLSKKEIAVQYPYEWQIAENLVYCDYLEHLFLHILICENPNPNATETVGMGGIIVFIVPEMNDVYSGWKTKEQWRATCHKSIINDKDVYLILIKRFMEKHKDCPLKLLLTSFNEQFGIWTKRNNKEIFEAIKSL